MSSINKQLNIPTNGSPFMYNASLYVEDKELADNFGAQRFKADGEWSNVLGQSQALSLLRNMNVLSWVKYPTCGGELKSMCQKCSAEAKSKPKGGWLQKGKQYYMECMNREISKLPTDVSSSESPTIDTPSSGSDSTPSGGSDSTPNGSNKTLLYVGVGLGVVALGFGIYFMVKK